MLLIGLARPPGLRMFQSAAWNEFSQSTDEDISGSRFGSLSGRDSGRGEFIAKVGDFGGGIQEKAVLSNKGPGGIAPAIDNVPKVKVERTQPCGNFPKQRSGLSISRSQPAFEQQHFDLWQSSAGPFKNIQLATLGIDF